MLSRARDARRTIAAMVAGVLLLAGTAALAPPAALLAPWAWWAFHLNAALNVFAVVLAFRVMRDALPALHEVHGEEAGRRLHRYAVLAAALMAVSAVVAAAAAWATGERINLAFVVPFLGVAALVYPTDARARRWTRPT